LCCTVVVTTAADTLPRGLLVLLVLVVLVVLVGPDMALAQLVHSPGLLLLLQLQLLLGGQP
jgi:hypothetical protein